MLRRSWRHVAVLVGFTFGACSRQPQGQPAQAAPVPVRVALVSRQAVPRLLETVGTVVSPRWVQVRPRVGGLVLAVHFQEGELVRRGQRLVDIDPAPYQNAVREAEARLARHQALLAKAEADLARAKVLASKDFIAYEQLDQAQANVHQLASTVEADRAVLEQARLQLSYCTIISPITGRAGELLVHPGNLVKASDDKALVTIAQVNPVDVHFAIPEVHLTELRAGLRQGISVEVRARNDGVVRLSGKVFFLDNVVDEHTGTVALKARLANDQELLWPGQFVVVTVRLGEEKNALVMPSSAVVAAQQGQSVFVVKPDNTVELRSVQVEAIVNNLAIVAQGLAEGETVVTDGQLRLVPGARVEVREL